MDRPVEIEDRDDLTGFYLRKAFDQIGKKVLVESAMNKQNFSLVHIDVDKFKKYNDRYGHAFGDLVLKYITSTLNLSLGRTDHYIFRYGGDEFVIILPEKNQLEAYKVMQHCRRVLRTRPFVYGNSMFKVSISCGIASFPADGQDKETLLSCADKAMYFSKRHGRGVITLYNRINYIKARNALFLLILIIDLAILFRESYRPYLRKYIEGFFNSIPAVKLVQRFDESDVIKMRSGKTIRGRILKRTPNEIIVDIATSGGTVRASLDTGEILSIDYWQAKDKQ